ncbi:class I tRNA ligase family protein [Anaeromicropila herbilytica]|uniref:Methionyl/Leucyl tRNA synthetase domain-containing protein n=1 Tax=Anaeromicropila herbilytica TaxID=2785025 RepID=A0A7R7IEG3_9FIRM|nr:class I tRNA ligase family protein [Anaeromicropila herbilytica]BCN31971.1 hypothetical protein bsdtb5_32660 [Anaeromicropila herbilytica]
MEDNNKIDRRPKKEKVRPEFPKRAVITAGMPYGNKELHFGHVGGVFVHADTFARFLRDRIGEENVIFVSGTDCYGSPILESYRKLVENGEFDGSIHDYVNGNHEKQKQTLEDYDISLNLYGASALDRASEIHEEVSKDIFESLYHNGYLEKLSTPQFYDPEYKVFLNGRQVVGKCPIEGCQSEKGYADECSLGHQYMPSELINPISALSSKKPELREVSNWYFKLEEFFEPLRELVSYFRTNTNSRKYQLNTMEEFLKKPIIYIKKSYYEEKKDIIDALPKHKLLEEEKKASITILFEKLTDREEACNILTKEGINYRTGKTLVPFRLTGNIEWGVKVPEIEGESNLTFWVWPESLWAPISFTKTYLESIGKDKTEWENWWKSKDAKVYQFIGEDNIYFYGVAQMALFMALQGKDYTIDPEEGKLRSTHLIANNHILFMDKKASSSSEIKPPMAKELLNYYTKEQLRIHFLSLGLSNKSVSFKPQVYMKEEEREGVDTVLKDGNLLTNVFNRLVRSCFYTAQKYYDSKIPEGSISDSVLSEAKEAILDYELKMYNHEFHMITYLLDTYLRNANKYWVNNMRIAEKEEDDALRKQVLIDSFHAVRTATAFIHPIAPEGCEMIRDYLNVSDKIWNWEYIFETMDFFTKDVEHHELKFLEPRIDFFAKHESQIIAE